MSGCRPPFIRSPHKMEVSGPYHSSARGYMARVGVDGLQNWFRRGKETPAFVIVSIFLITSDTFEVYLLYRRHRAPVQANECLMCVVTSVWCPRRQMELSQGARARGGRLGGGSN
jgi:hypothetical protein